MDSDECPVFSDRLDSTPNCAGTPTSTFFPNGGDQLSYKRKVRQAIAICEGCPLTEPCYQMAIDHDTRHGIWGGVNFNGRTPINDPKPRGCGTEAGWSRHARYAATTDTQITCAPCIQARRDANNRRALIYKQRKDA